MGAAGGAVSEAGGLGERILAEGFDLRPGQLPPLPRQEVAEGELSDRDTLELMNLVPEMREHAADLAVLSLVENHLEDGALLVLRLEVDVLGAGHSLRETDAAAELVEGVRSGNSRHLNEVFFLDAIPRVGEEIGQFTVVGDEDQPFAHPVEPADGEQPLLPRDEIDDAGPAVGVEVRGHHADRLGEHVNNALRVGEPLAVDPDLLAKGIDAGAELRDHLAVDLDPAGGDQFLAVPPAAEPGRREHLLKPFKAVIGRNGGWAESAAGGRLTGRLVSGLATGWRGAARRDPRATAAVGLPRSTRLVGLGGGGIGGQGRLRRAGGKGATRTADPTADHTPDVGGPRDSPDRSRSGRFAGEPPSSLTASATTSGSDGLR